MTFTERPRRSRRAGAVTHDRLDDHLARSPSIATDTTGDPASSRLEAATTAQDPRIVWKDLSTTRDADLQRRARRTGPRRATARRSSRPTGGYETARYGDKPFPMVPVDYRDRKHEPQRTRRGAARVVNSPDHPGLDVQPLPGDVATGSSTRTASVPSAGIATAELRLRAGLRRSRERDLTKPTCRGATLGQAAAALGHARSTRSGSSDGWYQLPGDTEYYGGDFPAFTRDHAGDRLRLRRHGEGRLRRGPDRRPGDRLQRVRLRQGRRRRLLHARLRRLRRQRRLAAQPVGCQDTVTYDNIWPHSSSLECTTRTRTTGLPGYISRRPADRPRGRPAVLDRRRRTPSSPTARPTAAPATTTCPSTCGSARTTSTPRTRSTPPA